MPAEIHPKLNVAQTISDEQFTIYRHRHESPTYVAYPPKSIESCSIEQLTSSLPTQISLKALFRPKFRNCTKLNGMIFYVTEHKARDCFRRYNTQCPLTEARYKVVLHMFVFE